MEIKPEKETAWSIDQTHSEINFKVKHLMIAHVKGTFKTFDASIHTHRKDFTTAEIDFWIDAASLSTGDEKRDEHVKSKDFLDVINHKQITFTSSSMMKPDNEGASELWGELTIAGTTKNIRLDVKYGGMVKDPWGNEKAGFAVSGKFNRKDWGLEWNTALEAGGVLVGDEIIFSADIELINKGPQDVAMKSREKSHAKSSSF